ncbi:MAG: helix-turn-helix domain-containing protein [Geminicoccaceae bacterium]|nr:helix-turn-helix domain-containing protein [Geminicoccaceae bacterium]
MIRSEDRPVCHRSSPGHHCEGCSVRPLAVCGALGPGELERLSRVSSSQRIAAGSCLIEEGEPAECVFTVLEGILKLYKLMPDGRRQVTGFLIPGDFVGLAFGESYIYTAEAVVEGAACRFTRNQFHRMMEEFPALEGRLLSKVSTELAAAQEQMLLLGRKTARERLATFLLGLARRMNRSAGEQVRLPMGRADIADFLGLTVETVSRTFTAMRKAGYLSTVDKHGVVITDLDRLREAAGD